MTVTLSERSAKSACREADRSLNDIREDRPLSRQAQDLRDRAAAIGRLRQSQFLRIRG